MSEYKNPYGLLNPDFSLGCIRRPKAVERLEAGLINVYEPSCISLVSERGMGAPMLVRYFLSKYQDKLPFQIVECDLKFDLGRGSALDFYIALITHIHKSLKTVPQEANKIFNRLQKTPPESLGDFFDEFAEGYFKAIHDDENSKPILLVMYSFDVVLEYFEFSEFDWVHLREFNNRPDLRIYYVVVSRRTLIQIEKTHKLFRSKFSSIFFQTQWVSLLDPEEVQNSISAVGRDVIGRDPWEDWLVELIVEYGGSNPYCTQYLCSRLFEEKWIRLRELTYEKALNIIQTCGLELEDYFGSLTANLEADRLIKFIKETINDGYDSYNQGPLDTLSKLGYFRPNSIDNRQYKLFSPLYHDYLHKHNVIEKAFAGSASGSSSNQKPVTSDVVPEDAPPGFKKYPTPTGRMDEISDSDTDLPPVENVRKHSHPENDTIKRLEKITMTSHSITWRAIDSLNRTVLFKEVIDDSFSENLFREAEMISRLDHPNIVKIWAPIRNPPGISVQWIEGKSLRHYITKCINSGSYFELDTVVKIAIHLTDALNYLHNKEFVHRDIKPENILLKEDNLNDPYPIIIDFDAARSIDFDSIMKKADGTGHRLGTPEYSAPEQLPDIYQKAVSVENMRRIGPKTDVFSLGLVLYELLTLKTPFDYKNNPKLHPDETLPIPSQLNIPDAIFEIICKMLRTNPEKRLSAKQVHERFEAYKNI